MNKSFSKWPGAWERHLIRRQQYPQFFEKNTPPSIQDIAEAQARDQDELTQFHLSLQSLIERFTTLTEDADLETINTIKKDLDACHNTAFGLGADLTEQVSAIDALNEVITSALRRTLQDTDEGMRLRLIQNEGKRLETLNRLRYPIVSDVLRSVSPISKGELSGALMCESNVSYKATLEVLSEDRKVFLAKRLDIILENLTSDDDKELVNHRLELLLKHLPEMPVRTKDTASG